MNRISKLLASLAVAVSCFPFCAVAQTKGDDRPYNLQKAYEVLQNDRDEEQALKLLSDQLKSTPDNVECWLLMCRVYRNREEYGSAMSCINEAIKVNRPKKSGFYKSTLCWWKGRVYSDMEESKKAAEWLSEALEAARKDNRDNIQNISFDLAQALYEMKDYDAADAVYSQMIEDDETDQAAMTGLARNMIERENYEGAVKMLDRSQKFDEDYSGTYKFRSEAYDKMGQTDLAIDDALLWFDKDDDASLSAIVPILLKHKTYAVAKAKVKMKGSDNVASWHALLVAIYEGSGDYELAIKEYDFLESEYGKDEFIYTHRADCYDELGLTDMALGEIDKAIAISDDAYNRSRRGDYLRGAGRYVEAIREYETMLEMAPDRAYVYYALGWCHELSGDKEKALEYYDAGIDIDQDYPYIYLMRGTYYHEHGDMAKAAEDFETVVKKDTTAESGSCTHYALHFLGRDEEAEAWMDRIIESDPGDAGNIYDKACLYARMGRLDESVKVLEQALEKGYCSFEHIRHDDDMDPIRGRDDFKALIARYEAKLAERVEKMGIEKKAEEGEAHITEVPISRHSGGTFDVACEVNGLSLNMIFDTGASDVSLSKVEADFMFKNNYISKDDIKGKKYYQTADGGISEGTVVTLKEVRIGDAVLHNVDASVTKSQKAPLLLGQSVLEKFGTFTVDNINSKLIIKQ